MSPFDQSAQVKAETDAYLRQIEMEGRVEEVDPLDLTRV